MANTTSRSTKLTQQRVLSLGIAVMVICCSNAVAQFPQVTELSTEAAINLHPKTPLNPDRLWLPPQHAKVAGLLLSAAHRALEHPDCAEVLYGGLNEFRTEREGTSFTVMCIKDARTTFNQVFHERDLIASEVRSPEEEAAARAEMERLRNLIQNPSGQRGTQTPGQLQDQQQQTPQATPQNQAAPTVF